MISRMEVLANELGELLDKIREEGFEVIAVDVHERAYIDLSDGRERTPVDTVRLMPRSEAPPYIPLNRAESS